MTSTSAPVVPPSWNLFECTRDPPVPGVVSWIPRITSKELYYLDTP